jgi:hypothetical protein
MDSSSKWYQISITAFDPVYEIERYLLASLENQDNYSLPSNYLICGLGIT